MNRDSMKNESWVLKIWDIYRREVERREQLYDSAKWTRVCSCKWTHLIGGFFHMVGGEIP
jgi:hypothetical protein